MTRMGYSTAQAGLAIAAYGVGSLCASLIGGHLADRLGRRKTIGLSMFSGAIAMLFLSQAHRLPMIILFSGPAGFTGDISPPPHVPFPPDLAPPAPPPPPLSPFH